MGPCDHYSISSTHSKVKLINTRVNIVIAWWRHQMETFSALLGLYVGNSPVTGEFPSQRPVTWSFDVFVDLCQHNRLSKQSRRWWFERESHSLWRHCNVSDISTQNIYTVFLIKVSRMKTLQHNLTCWCLMCNLLMTTVVYDWRHNSADLYACFLVKTDTWPVSLMMMSSNGNIFRVTGHLCEEFTGPCTKASYAEL